MDNRDDLRVVDTEAVVWTSDALPSEYLTARNYNGKLTPRLMLSAIELLLCVRGDAPKEYQSPFNDLLYIVTAKDLASDIREITEICTGLRGVCTFFHEIGTKALFRVMMLANLPKIDLLMVYTPRGLLYDFHSRFTATLVRRFELFYEDLQQADALIGSLCLINCTFLEEIHIRVLKGKEEDIDELISGVPIECKPTLWRFECYLPRSSSHVPFYYIQDMTQLRILTIAYSGSIYEPDPDIAEYPPLDRSKFPTPFTLSYLDRLRVHRVHILERMVLYPTPNLKALRVDYELEYDVSRALGSFLYVNGKNLQHMDLRHVGQKRDVLLFLAPDLKDAVFDVRGKMWMFPEWPERLQCHNSLETVALKGCVETGLVPVIRWALIIMYLNFFSMAGNFPSLERVWLMDMRRSYFRLMPWSPFEARQWYKVLKPYFDRNVLIIDCDKGVMTEEDLNALESHALGIRRPVIDTDSENSD